MSCIIPENCMCSMMPLTYMCVMYICYLSQRCELFKAAVRDLGTELVLKMEGYALLQYVAQLGYVPIIQFLLRSPDVQKVVNKKTYLTESTPLLTAVRCNHLNEEDTTKTVEELIEHGASVNAENKDGNTPLFMAIRRGLKQVFLVMLNKEADIESVDVVGNTTLHAAAEVNAIYICEEIVDRAGREILATRNDDGQTAIHLAAMHDSKCLEAIILALKKRYLLGITAMHKPEWSKISISGLEKDYPEAVEWFSAVDSKGCTPLDIAAKADQRATFDFMWEEMEDYSPVLIAMERRNLSKLIAEAEENSSQWQKVTDAIRAFPKRM